MMTLIAFPNDSMGATSFLPARAIGHGTVPWVPLSPGKSFKPLRFLRDDRGFVELMRLDPGEEIPLHRHTGEVHALNLEGSRELKTRANCRRARSSDPATMSTSRPATSIRGRSSATCRSS